MATLTESDGTREDQRGKELAEKSTPLDQHGAKPLSGNEKDQLDDIEKGLAGGDTAAKPKTGGAGSNSSGSSGNAGDSGGGNRLANAFKGVGSFAGNHKRGLLAGGGVGGIIAAVIFGFISLLPLKIESMMKNIFEKRVGQYAERSIEARMDKLAQTYLSKSLQAGAEGDATADKEFDKLIVSQGHLTKDILKTWRVNKFATNLQKNQGVTFQRGSKLGTVDVYQDGKLMGNYGSADSRQLVRDSIRNETKWYQFYKRHHLRVWMKNALNIQSWKFFKGTSGEDGAQTEVRAELVDAATAAYGEEIVKVLDCALDNTCDTNNESHDGDSDQALREGIQEADQAASETVKSSSRSLTTAALSKIFGQAFAEKIGGVLAKLTSTAAVLGIIDVFSRFDHFFYDGYADKALVSMHKLEYASQFSQWLTINDQIKEGTAPDGKKITGDEVNAIMEQVGDPAKSAAFQQLYLGKTGNTGQKLGTANDGSDQSVSHSIDEHATPIKDEYVFLASGGDPSGFGASVGHDVLNAWYVSGGKVMDIVNSVAGFVLRLAEHVIPGLGDLMNAISKFALNFILKFLPAAVTGVESDGDLFNNLDAGGSVVGQEFMQNIGAAATTVSETNSINQEIADNQAAETKKLSLADRIFSTDYNNSLVNTLAIMAPASPSAAASQTAGYMASIFTNPMQWFGRIFGTIPTPFNNFATAATAPADLYGLNHYDFTDSDLSQPIDDKDLDTATANAAKRLSKSVDDITPDDVTLEDCPDTGDKDNLCKLDLVTLQSAYAQYTDTDNGGVNNGGN